LRDNFSKENTLFIFSDDPKTIKDEKTVNEVRDYINNLIGLKSIRISGSVKNLE